MKTLLSVLLFSILLTAKGTPPDLSAKHFIDPPHRIIRTCCAFGSELRVWIIPGFKLNDITSIENLGPHQYLGNPHEGNGIIYTRNGGFIDLGHLRDQADWTAYLHSQVLLSQQKGELTITLGREGGLKRLNLRVPPDLEESDLILLAGKIAYDLSVWHEIATWFGSSTIPFIAERYSSFSIEDPYSNLMGVTLGMKALKSELPYEQAMTSILHKTLDSIGVVININETYKAMEAVRNIWWTRDKSLPSRKILVERHLDVYSRQVPWLVPGWGDGKAIAFDLEVPSKTRDGRLLEEFYQLEFKLNTKFPVKEIFASRDKRLITQADFSTLLSCIERQLAITATQIR